MKKQAIFLGLLSISTMTFAQKKKNDSLQVRTIEDVNLHKTGNPNKGKYFTNKSNLSVMENPQASAIVTHEIIEQQQAQQISDVVRNVNGVYLTSSRGASQDSFGARGYTFGSDNIFKNGSRVNSGIFPEVSGLERVEVLKGGAAILYGNVAPGGIVNMITKKPLFNQGGNISLNAGSWNNYKPTIDIYGALSKNIAFRMNGAYEYKDSFRDLVHSQKHYFNPSFLFNISDKTQIIVEADYLKHHFTPDFGLGSLMDDVTKISTLDTGLKRNQFIGTDWQYQINQMLTSTITLNHQFNENWALNSVAAYQNYTKDYFSTERVQWLVNTTNKLRNPERSWERPLNRTYNEQNYASLQFNLNGSFETGPLSHKLLLGADGDYNKADAYAYYDPANGNKFGTSYIYGTGGKNNTPSATNPNYILLDNPATWISGAMPNSNVFDITIAPSYRYGAYVQDLISLGKFKVLAGVRFSYLENKNTTTKEIKANKETENRNSSIHRAFSPKAGLIYQHNDNFMAFASYTNSFTPNTGFNIHDEPLAPSIIDQYEIGIKKNLWNNTIAVNLTAYQIENSNLAQMAILDKNGNLNSNANIKELSGKTRSRGVELDITGNPLPNLQLIGGFSYNNMVYVSTPNSKGSFVEGERLVRTPATTANASVFYTLPKYIKGLKLGATAFYTGNRWAGWNNTKGQTQVNRLIEVGDFTTLDLSIGYQFKKVMVQGKVGNVFDTLNYNIHENYSVNPITPRNYYITLTYKL
ncbi:MAG: TonB-dependent siderophore receptor [Cloacibacterium sp.]|nr:TonB-dependent siderophore receptor [Cloacibacterium sp.]